MPIGAAFDLRNQLRQAASHGGGDFVVGQFGRNWPVVQAVGNIGGDELPVIADHDIAAAQKQEQRAGQVAALHTEFATPTRAVAFGD